MWSRRPAPNAPTLNPLSLTGTTQVNLSWTTVSPPNGGGSITYQGMRSTIPGGPYTVLEPAALRVEWRLRDGARLLLLGNLADEPVSVPEPIEEGRLLYSSGDPPDHMMPPQSAAFYLLAPR